MRKKILIVATITRHIVSFHLPFIKRLKQEGYEIHIASNNSEFNYESIPFVDKMIEIPFKRSPFDKENIKSYSILKKKIIEEEYDLIHTHTPVASVISRMALKKSKKKGKMIYTSHGFHFYKGASLFNWLVYYNVEKYLSNFTDILITINQEDFNIASKFKRKCRNVILTDGVGVDLKKFNLKSETQKNEMRTKNGFDSNDFIMFYAAELNNNKNHKFLLENLYEVFQKNKNIKLVLAGSGPNMEKLKNKCQKLEIEDNVFFLGQRNDVNDLMKMADILVSASQREGLPTNVIEGLATGIPGIVSNCRGNRDLINNGINGFIFKNKHEFKNIISKIINNKILLDELKENCRESVQKYDLNSVNEKLIKIYKKELEGKKNISREII